MEAVRSTLKIIGLTDRETDVYILLARSTLLTGMDVSKRLGMHKAQAYTILNKLQEKRMIEATLGTPTRYYPIPIEAALNEVVKAKRSEADSIEKDKDEILAYWQRMQPPIAPATQERFAALPTKEAVQSRLMNMINDATNEIQVVMTAVEVIRAYHGSLLENLEERLAEKKALHVKILAPISFENVTIVKRFLKTGQEHGSNIEWRHAEFDPMHISPLITKDGRESCMFPAHDSTIESMSGSALWTNGRVVTRICLALFAELWRGGMPVEEKIRELEGGDSQSVSIQIDDPRAARKRFLETISKAKREVIHILPLKKLAVNEQTRPFWQIPTKGVKVRLMFPFGRKQENGKRLPKAWEIRDPDVNYLAITAVDRCHLFRFNIPAGDDLISDSLDYFKGMSYTNDPRQVVPICQMLDGLWDRASSNSRA